MNATTLTPLQRFLASLRSPWVVMGSLLAALFFGSTFPENSLAFKPLGDVYLSLLKMVVLPFLLSAIIGSIAKLVQSQEARQYLGRMSVVYSVGLVLTACIGLVLALIIQPGHISADESRSSLGEVVRLSKSAASADFEISLTETPDINDNANKALSEAVKYIPSNIFEALTFGDTLKVLIFSVIFGVAAGLTANGPGHGQGFFVAGLDNIYRSCQTLMRWLTYPLPFAVLVIVSAEVAKSGVFYLLAMQDFVVTQIAASVILILAATLIISVRLKMSIKRVVLGLSEPSLMAVSTSSSATCLPSAIDALTHNLKTPVAGTELVMPLGVTMFRFGPAFYFTICTIFVAQMYSRDLAVTDYFFIVFASVMASLASAGTSGILTISLISLICVPLRLPFEAALALFIAADTFVDPFRTLAIVYGNCAASVCITGGENQTDLKSSHQKAEA